MGRYKLIIFDFDGTLADSLEWFSVSINLAAKAYNFQETSLDEMEQLRHQKSREIMRFLGVPWWKVPFIASYMRKLMSSELSQIRLFPGVEELLWGLRQQSYVLAIVSSNSLSNIEQIIGTRNLAYFKFVECGVSMFGKRHKYKKLFKKSKIPLLEILSIGDETRDIEAAKSSGIKSAAVGWGFAKPSALQAEKPDHYFSTIHELHQFLIHQK
jgi:phosphoglycolate phosphatase